jgi:hypothetical protein
MSRIIKSRRTKVLLGAVAALAIVAAAVAYWTSSGSSSTTAGTQAGNGTAFSFTPAPSTASDLAPGVSAKELTGAVKNSDTTANYKLQTITATLKNVTGAGTADTDHPACTVDDYRLSNLTDGSWVVSSTGGHTNNVATLTVGNDLAAGASQAFAKLGVAMFDSSSNQDTCKGATLNLDYSAA